MRYLYLLGVFISLLTSCNQQSKSDEITESTDVEFRAEELPKRVKINAKSSAIVNEWAEYTAFDNSFNALYSATNNEDLILVIDDLLDKQKTWEKSVYPEEFDRAQIRSRQNVMKTYLLKVKSALLTRTEFTDATIEMIEAYNALRTQFDVTMNSSLDPKLLEDES